MSPDGSYTSCTTSVCASKTLKPALFTLLEQTNRTGILSSLNCSLVVVLAHQLTLLFGPGAKGPV